MEKEFIPYEQALALKELGFREHCAAFYSTEEELCFKWESNGNMSLHLLRLIQAPTFSQAFRWFREKYGLYTQDFIDLDNKFTKNIVQVNKNGQDFFYLDYYKKYEEAELECLKKLIERIKQ
jgi:hypothetical protein